LPKDNQVLHPTKLAWTEAAIVAAKITATMVEITATMVEITATRIKEITATRIKEITATRIKEIIEIKQYL
jgi:hypothetical protein